jgi:hypothetical protein
VEWTPDRQRWLEESCRASGVPLKVTDPAAIARVAVLLGAGGNVARSNAARERQGLRSNGKVTSSAREVGQYGNTRPREDVHVRRARRMETDGRLRSARAEQEAHERKLQALDAELSTQVHVPYRPSLAVVPEPQEQPVVPAKQSKDIAMTTAKVDVHEARELLAQGYHIARVVERTGVPVDMIKNLVGADGYRRGGA